MTDTDVAHRGRIDRLHGQATFLLLSKAIQMIMGLTFWVVIAHEADLASVGRAAAAVSLVLICTQIAVLGAGSAMITWLGAGRSLAQGLSAAVSLLVASGVLVALAALTATGHWDSGPLFAAVFVIAVVSGTQVILMDQVSVALGRAQHVTVRYLAGAGTCLILVLGHTTTGGSPGALQIMSIWATTSGVAAVVGVLQVVDRRWTVLRPSRDLATMRVLVTRGVPQQVLTVCERVPLLLVPVVLAHAVSAESAALWYAAWMLTWAVYTVPLSVGLVQFAGLAGHPQQVRAYVRRGGAYAVGLGLPAALALGAMAPWVLSAMGPDYVAHALAPLRILLVGLIPYAVLQAWNAVSRSRGQWALPSTVGLAVGVVGSGGAWALGAVSIVLVAWVVVGGLGAGAVVAGLSLRRWMRLP